MGILSEVTHTGFSLPQKWPSWESCQRRHTQGSIYLRNGHHGNLVRGDTVSRSLYTHEALDPRQLQRTMKSNKEHYSWHFSLLFVFLFLFFSSCCFFFVFFFSSFSFRKALTLHSDSTLSFTSFPSCRSSLL